MRGFTISPTRCDFQRALQNRSPGLDKTGESSFPELFFRKKVVNEQRQTRGLFVGKEVHGDESIVMGNRISGHWTLMGIRRGF